LNLLGVQVLQVLQVLLVHVMLLQVLSVVCAYVIVCLRHCAVIVVAGAVIMVALTAVAVGCWQSKHILLFISLVPVVTVTSTPHSVWMGHRHCGHL
jgi:hypothetical protein